MATARDAVLAQIERWHADGVISSELRDKLREHALADPVLAAPIVPPPAAPQPTAPSPGVGARASEWLQLVGGALVGAAFVALVSFLNVPRDQVPLVLAGLGSLALAGGLAIWFASRGARVGLADAALAAGLVALTVGGLVQASLTHGLYAWLAAAAGVVTFVVRRGQGPIVILAGAAYALGTLGAIVLSSSGGDNAAPAWLATLVAFGGVVLYFRRETWSDVGAGLLLLPQVAAFIGTMDALHVPGSRTTELLLGAFLGAWLAIGVWLGVRGLVAAAAAGLTIDAVVFAFDLGGALSAFVLLIVLGGALVWQAEFIRHYFGKRKAL